MSQAVILLWVSTTGFGQAATNVSPIPTLARESPRTFAYTPPTPRERQTLAAWAKHRHLTLEPPRAEPSEPRWVYDSRLVQMVEQLLEAARLSAGSLDEELAIEQLRRAEALVYAHPELPQAAYLLAEAAWQQAALADRQGHARLAEIQRGRAARLEGARVPPYAAATQLRTGPGTDDSDPLVPRVLNVKGPAPSDSLVWDGIRQATLRLTTSVGEHHVQVLREHRIVWAGFVTVHPDPAELILPVPAPAPCTLSDFSSVSLAEDRVDVAPPVRCAAWAVARPSTISGIDVALCQFDRCGPLLNWRQGFGEPLRYPLHEPHPWRLPSWTSYVAAGVGTAAAASLLLWQSGAFDEPARGPASWTFGGVAE